MGQWGRFCLSRGRKRLLTILCLVVLVACSDKVEQEESIQVVESESQVVYVQELGVIAPSVCMETDTSDPDSFLIDIQVMGELEEWVDPSSNRTIDSRDVLQAQNVDGRFFCTGNNLQLTKELTENELEQWIREGNLRVSLTDMNGELITEQALTDFKVGNLDGSVE
ncbi:hypothetical protein EQV77_06545 [Halobacillus fulvus]|nr:hypothetical protein EQV77_06545 [Halobacillus fulvus]